MENVDLPSVDVIIPAFNANQFIAETIKSVLSQTHLPRHIIVVDDGSTDNTTDIVKGFKSNIIRLISVQNGGVSRARNVGIYAADADYIAFLDADDVWVPCKLQEQLLKLKKNTSAGVCYTGSQLIDSEGVHIEDAIGVPYVRGWVFQDIVYYERPIYGSASSIIVARDLLLQTDLFDESMQFSEDVDLWARLALLTEFDFVSEPLVKIRVHSNSATRNKSWNKDAEILLQHFYYINKFLPKYTIPKEAIDVQKNRIVRLFFSYPYKLPQIGSFYKALRRRAPDLAIAMKFDNFVFMILGIGNVTINQAFARLVTRALPFQRLKLLFSEGTIFFSKSKKYNADVEFLKKRR